MTGGVLVIAWTLAVTGAVQDRFPDADGKPELMKVCSGCHDAEIVLAHLQTPGEWAETLQKMVQLGAEATPDEWRQIERYLDVQFALIQVNKASANELRLTMDVTTEVAGAVVKYRQANGPFKSVDGLKKVAGVDAAKIDSRKDRFVF
jgi:competence ComEA-like helix-hairpin-helix protein